MCKIDAVNSKNWAQAINTPAAISCSSDISSDVKAKTAATKKEAAAKVFSKREVFLIRVFHALGSVFTGVITIVERCKESASLLNGE